MAGKVNGNGRFKEMGGVNLQLRIVSQDIQPCSQ